MARINLVAPWDEYYNKMAAFFKDDPYVTVLYEEEAKIIKVLVQEAFKAEALTKLLKSELSFGDVKLTITVLPANGDDKYAKASIASLHENEGYEAEYRCALEINPLYSYVKTIKGMMGFDAVFVVFKKKVIQYYDDNLGDLNGVKSTLAENIARDIFVTHSGIFFCTDTRDVNETDASNISALPYPCQCH